MPVTQSLTNLETAEKLGLNAEEFEKIKEILGRTPNFTELSIYSVMWSEHCSYKNSIRLLKTLPRDGENLLVGAGEENAGLVDVGGGLACAFKIESHNHPSCLEPYQGAATGVGGIHRDIFTMGARPIAAMNSLRFGNLEDPHMQHLVKGVVKGIGDYGNCFGVPTVGGEAYFDPCYQQNILVNAFSAGIVKDGATISAVADGPGNPVFIIGSATGKDGIHGATFASADLTEDSAEDLPSVQVGDPFQEKLLLEASLELIRSGAVVGMQDMGAAGITCSTSEMSAKSGTGMQIYLDKVPTRQSNMVPFEILLSESQERMLVVAKKGQEDVLFSIFDKWDLECQEIGVVTDSGRLEFYWKGEKVADVDAHSLVLGGGAPVYTRESQVPAYMSEIALYDISQIDQDVELKAISKKLIAKPTIASKKWIYTQYDSMVRTNTMTTNKASDASCVRIKGTDKALVMSVDCNSGYVYADPKKGAMIAVAEAARNIICTGGQPIAITNCLNFGNPYNPEVYYQFENAIAGMGEACRKFNTPVTGGNVSFYNQSTIGDITIPVNPTPTIGMLGLMDDHNHQQSISFEKKGDIVMVIGINRNDLSSSQYVQLQYPEMKSPCPYFDLEEEFHMQQVMQKMATKGIFSSIHDVSEGGIFVNLCESGFDRKLGFQVKSDPSIRKDAFLFGESQSRVVVSFPESHRITIEEFLDAQGQPYGIIGVVTEGEIVIDNEVFGTIDEYFNLYDSALNNYLD